MSTDDRQPRPLIRNYDDLQAAVRARSTELGMTRADLDARAGLADGHAGKLLGRRQVKRFGNITLGLVLGALGSALVLVEDNEATAAAPINASARILAKRRAVTQTPDQRSAAARKAAAARWRKRRGG